MSIGQILGYGEREIKWAFMEFAGVRLLGLYRLGDNYHYDYNDYNDLSGGVMATQDWTVAEAKAKFSEVIERALSDGPQTITRNGRKTAVIVGAEEWERKAHRVGNLAEFFANSPLRGSGLKIRRSKERPRKINL
ncbi:MAG TPA: type II toxin-antitoxin system Phd/YefM family antitoxin [Terriglobales bacterium]|nr:type II toxin-antitoxin system Phd/YefM family antitoxin [Terriglobales bacterium]